MAYFVTTIVTNSNNQITPNIEKKDTLEQAATKYHTLLASYHNTAEVLYAVAEILDEYGRIVGGDTGYHEIVDHRPEPLPEPEES